MKMCCGYWLQVLCLAEALLTSTNRMFSYWNTDIFIWLLQLVWSYSVGIFPCPLLNPCIPNFSEVDSSILVFRLVHWCKYRFQSKIKNKMANHTGLMKWLISCLIWSYTVCTSIGFGLRSWKGYIYVFCAIWTNHLSICTAHSTSLPSFLGTLHSGFCSVTPTMCPQFHHQLIDKYSPLEAVEPLPPYTNCTFHKFIWLPWISPHSTSTVSYQQSIHNLSISWLTNTTICPSAD